MKYDKNKRTFWANCQSGIIINDPLRCQLSPPPQSQQTQIVYRDRVESSKPLIDPLTMFAVALAINH